MKKYFVLDTNVLLHNPHAIYSFQDNTIVIPITVIEEIDTFKKGIDEKGRNAREVGRVLDALRGEGSLQEGIKMEHGGILQVIVTRAVKDTLSGLLANDKNDNLIIGTALYLKKQKPEDRVILVSKDANVRIKADALGLEAENYENDNINFDELFTGFSDLTLPATYKELLNGQGYLDNKWGEYCPNQFIRLFFEGEETPEYLRFHYENNTFNRLYSYKEDKPIFGILPRNPEQRCALDLLLDDDIKLVSLVGIAGTGKTLLAMAAGLEMVVERGKYSRLIVSRPISPLGKDLGYLPGSKQEKFNPWMQPVYDNMEILLLGHQDHKDDAGNQKVFNKKKTTVEEYLDFGFIELEPLTYIRGRSLPNQYIVVDEAQNLTPHEMKTIITRAGEGTKIVLTGDPYQIDIPYLDSESNGLSMSVEKFKKEQIVGHVTLTKGERSALADIAAKYF